MQVVVAGQSSTQDEGWTAVPWGDGTKYYKFGDGETLTIRFGEEN